MVAVGRAGTSASRATRTSVSSELDALGVGQARRRCRRRSRRRASLRGRRARAMASTVEVSGRAEAHGEERMPCAAPRSSCSSPRPRPSRWRERGDAAEGPREHRRRWRGRRRALAATGARAAAQRSARGALSARDGFDVAGRGSDGARLRPTGRPAASRGRERHAAGSCCSGGAWRQRASGATIATGGCCCSPRAFLAGLRACRRHCTRLARISFVRPRSTRQNGEDLAFFRNPDDHPGQRRPCVDYGSGSTALYLPAALLTLALVIGSGTAFLDL